MSIGNRVFDLHFYTYFRVNADINNEIKDRSSYNVFREKRNVKFIVRREDDKTFRFLAPESQSRYGFLNYRPQHSVEDLKEEYYELPWSVWKTLDLSNK